MSIAVCKSCTRYVDTDFAPMSDEGICEVCEDAGDYLVCAHCGSINHSMAGKHGFIQCNNCGEEDHAIFASEYEPSEAQQGLIPIPEGYVEQ